ncbi:MAG: hypothetical protein LM580_01495 [Thermofilum sp.]|nr:hypothetical protein [Thermofilum sp.]
MPRGRCRGRGLPLLQGRRAAAALASSEGWGAGEPRREPLERALLRLLGLVGLPLFLFEVLGRAAPPRSLPVKALSPLLLALAAWGLERVREG